MGKLVDERERLFENILRSVGDDGPYQKFLFWAFMASFSVILPFTNLTQFFQVSVPDHWCHVPGRPVNMSMEEWKNITIPWELKTADGDFTRSKCKQFTDFSAIYKPTSEVPTPFKFSNDSDSAAARNVTECQMGWEYDHTWYDATLATEQDWVCNDSSLSAVWISVGATGNLVGALLFALMTDKYGRKPSLTIATLIYVLFSLTKLYITQSRTLIMIMMFFCGLPFPYLYQITIVLLYEQITTKWRERAMGVNFIAWLTGICILPLIAWLCRDWKLLGIVTTLPFIPMFLVFWYIFESPRWLAARGHLSQARSVLSSIAKRNGKELPRELDHMIQSLNYHEMNATEETILELFRHKNLRIRTLLLTSATICNTLIYYGLIYTIHYVSGNEFLNFFYLSIAELPGTLLGWKLSAIFGRRWTQVGAFVTATGCCSAAFFLADSTSSLTVVLLISCKAVICMSFMIVYMQQIEFYPTSHRASGGGFNTTVTAAFVFGVPYIAYSETYWPGLSFLIMACLGILGIITSSLLPETMGIPLPQTIEEGEQSVADQKYWSYYGWRPKIGKHFTETTQILQ